MDLVDLNIVANPLTTSVAKLVEEIENHNQVHFIFLCFDASLRAHINLYIHLIKVINKH